MKEGTIKFFNHEKGFGFISIDGSDEDIFVHSSGLIDQVQEHDNVQFSTEMGKKGLNAVEVRVLR